MFVLFLMLTEHGTEAPSAYNGSSRLLAYFDSVIDGPGVWKSRHYFDIYERHTLAGSAFRKTSLSWKLGSTVVEAAVVRVNCDK